MIFHVPEPKILIAAGAEHEPSGRPQYPLFFKHLGERYRSPSKIKAQSCPVLVIEAQPLMVRPQGRQAAEYDDVANTTESGTSSSVRLRGRAKGKTSVNPLL